MIVNVITRSSSSNDDSDDDDDDDGWDESVNEHSVINVMSFCQLVSQ